MPALNYAAQYSQALANAFPYSLNFGALYATPTNGRYRIVDAKTIQIPTMTTTGRVNADRDTIATASRNYDNNWETKTLTNQRKWSTLVHPMDIDQTNMVASIANITKTFNEFQKFPEMDAYTISKIHADWVAAGGVENNTSLSTSNVLSVFDTLMLNMDNARVPANGRILYVTYEVKSMLKEAQGLTRQFDVQSNNQNISRLVSRLDEVQVIGVPATLMKTLYNFTAGWVAQNGADQINMCLIHPLVVITPVSYAFVNLEAPSAMSEGKWVYYEESFEDVFVLNQQIGGIQMNVTAAPLSGLTVTTADGSVSGDTAVTVSGNAASGTALYYKAADAVIDVPYGTTISTNPGTGVGDGWTSLATNPDDVTVAANKVITVVETSSSKAIQGGSANSHPKS